MALNWCTVEIDLLKLNKNNSTEGFNTDSYNIPKTTENFDRPPINSQFWKQKMQVVNTRKENIHFSQNSGLK